MVIRFLWMCVLVLPGIVRADDPVVEPCQSCRDEATWYGMAYAAAVYQRESIQEEAAACNAALQQAIAAGDSAKIAELSARLGELSQALVSALAAEQIALAQYQQAKEHHRWCLWVTYGVPEWMPGPVIVPRPMINFPLLGPQPVPDPAFP